MFDTHCHLNFKFFLGKEEEVIKRAIAAGVNYFLVPGTDVVSSQKAVKLANKYPQVYAAVGIHPHHSKSIKSLDQIEKLLNNKKVVAVGEVGIDKHSYQKTKYDNYQIDEEFINSQKILLTLQIKLAIKYDKSLIFHNWEAKDDFVGVLNKVWDKKLEGRVVFHCCEPADELLQYARKHKIYIGVDGDVTYNKLKQEFVKKIPLELLVLETVSPYLTPEPTRQTKKFPNEPVNIPIIADFIAKITANSMIQIIQATTNNAKKLFSL